MKLKKIINIFCYKYLPKIFFLAPTSLTFFCVLSGDPPLSIHTHNSLFIKLPHHNEEHLPGVVSTWYLPLSLPRT